MAFAWKYTRSLVFVVQMYLAMAVLGILFSPYAVLSRRGAFVACRAFCAWALWTARWMVGIRTELRGEIPQDEVMIASKHQSFLDILIIFGTVPRPKFIMKRELMWTPFIGLYAKRLGCIPITRGRGSETIAKMVKDVAEEFKDPGQLIIYPQGTRVEPGGYKTYKVGGAVLYEQLDQPGIPAATNVGLFWPKRGIIRHPGLAIVEFLPRIEPGLDKKAFMQRLETTIETRTNELLADAGFVQDEENRRPERA